MNNLTTSKQSDRIDWKRKLSSRKFWATVVNFVTNLLVVFNVPDNQVVQITALIMAGAGVIAYIVAEGFVDAETVAQTVVYRVETEGTVVENGGDL